MKKIQEKQDKIGHYLGVVLLERKPAGQEPKVTFSLIENSAI